jgi:hypothetical protein
MSVLKRIGNIIRSRKEPPVPAPQSTLHPLEGAAVGDIMSVDLEEYVISGKVTYYDPGYAPHRFAYYLQSGRDVICLLVEKGRTYDTYLCNFLEGALDDPNEVPTRLEVDGKVTYDLESHRTDRTRTDGNTDFRNGDEVLIWRYFADQDRHFILQWQDGKFVAMEGTRIPAAEVKVLKSK